jgi:hypothetical protein
MPEKLRVLVACEFSGTVRDAYRSRGYDAWSCDLLPSERERVVSIYREMSSRFCMMVGIC